MSQRRDEMIDFIDEVNKTIHNRDVAKELSNTPKAKRNILNGVKSQAKEVCLDKIFNKIYKDALPINPEYKEINNDDLDKEFRGFIQYKAPKGLEYYVRESIKKGNKTGKVLMESVDKLINNIFFETGLNLNDIDVDDIKFDEESPEFNKGITEITDKMGTEEISEIIKDNVKQAALNDITRQKERDDEIKTMVDNLKNDPTVTTEAVLDRKLTLAGITSKRNYTPTLFEGIMVNKTNLIKESGEDILPEDIGKKAFTESVKEITKLSVLHSLNFENVSLSESKSLALKYANMKIPSSTVSLFNEDVEEHSKFMLDEDRIDFLESMGIDDNFSDYEVMYEGANLEIRRAFVAERKAIKTELKEMKKLVKKKEYGKAKEKMDSVVSRLDKVEKEIDAVNADNLGSTILGFFVGNIMFLGRILVGSLIPFGLFVVDIDLLIKRLNVLLSDLKKKDNIIEKEDLNMYRNGIKVRVEEYKKICKIYSEKLDKANKELDD